MPYTTGWLVQDRLLNSYLYGNVTADDMLNSLEEIAQLMRDVKQAFLLIDLRDATDFPRELPALLQEMRQVNLPADAVMTTLMLSSNPLHQFFGSLAAKALNTPMRSFKTSEELRQFVRTTAPDLALLFRSREAIGE